MSESRVAAQVGKVLGGRYRLVAPIGFGASGEVYLADDIRLRRQVAVKVLHPVLAGDEVFLDRFRSEAQTAASLQHKHVVAVHDWGEDEVPFIVTEYLGGGSLRAMLDQAGNLSPSQTLLIGLGAAEGLDYAHKRGVVQRDIKPGNLLFDSEAEVRIADFGLAKALAEASVTEPGESMVGTVRYASPEQAQGRRVDASSDVYSLGLVMYEAVAGTLPFDADTPIGTLMARVETPVEPDPDVFGPLAEPIRLATSISPVDRPDAGALHRLLLAAAEGMSRPDPLPLAGAVTFDPTTAVDRDPTMVGAAAVASGPAGGSASTPPATTPRRAAAGARGERGGRRRRRWPWMILMTLLLAAIGLGAFFAFQTAEVPTRLVPEAEGLTPDQLRAEVADFWQLEEAFDRQDGSVVGTILRTDPDPGVELEEGLVVTYFVSQGNELRDVPSGLVGRSLGEAEQFLTGAGLILGEVSERNDEEAAPDVVVEVATLETQLPGGSSVDLIVSSGPAARSVPDTLIGLTVEEAQSQLAVDRLGAETVEVYDNGVSAGLVISVDPPAGTEVARDSVVTLTVSLGRQPVTVPNVAGLDVLAASDDLEAAGLCIGETDGPANTPVIGTDPPAGTTVFFGDCVRIITSEALADG